MSTARKYAFKKVSMSVEARRSAYAAINILWKQMRPDLHFESKDVIRDERLSWIATFLELDGLDSTTSLSDKQLLLLLDEMRQMTGTKSEPKPKPQQPRGNVVQLSDYKKPETPTVQTDAVIKHLKSDEQLFTLEKLEKYIGWTVERRENYLKPRFGVTTFQMLQFKQANALIVQMLNIAAHKDLTLMGKKTGRAENAKYIPTLKKKLEIH